MTVVIWGLRITNIDKEWPEGLVHCVLFAQDFLRLDDFLMYLGDDRRMVLGP